MGGDKVTEPSKQVMVRDVYIQVWGGRQGNCAKSKSSGQRCVHTGVEGDKVTEPSQHVMVIMVRDVVHTGVGRDKLTEPSKQVMVRDVYIRVWGEIR